MSKIGDLLNRTVRDETKSGLSLSVYIVIICSVIISFGCFLGFYCVVDVDEYLQDNKQIINLYDFYDQKVGKNETSIFFIGSSILGRAIYPPKINQLIKMNYPNITAYNLYISSDIPIERTLEIQKIVDAKPSLVIYGISYRSVTDDIDYSHFFERTKLVYSRLNIRDDSLFLYNEAEIMYFTPISNLDKKKYLFSAIQYAFNGRVQEAFNYSFDPYGGEEYRKSLPKVGRNVIAADANNLNSIWRPVVTNESTRYKDALIYNVKTLQDAGIPVIILNMPLHPLYSEKITDESRANFYTLLNETCAIWYDLERDYDEDYFNDGIHASFDGAMKFAPRMADLIIEQVEKDVIHYT